MPAKTFLWLSTAVFAVACSASTTAYGPAGGPDQDAGEDAPINTSGMELVQGLAITEVAVFQGPKVSLEKDGVRTGTRRAPVIVGREGLLRVYVKPADDWAEREVVATLSLEGGAGPKTLTVKKSVSIASIDDNLDSTINFDLPLDLIAPDSSYSVSLKTEKGQTSAGGSDAAQYPADGSRDTFDAKSTGEKLQVKIVPIKYMADGSGRLPDTSEAQLELYRKGFQRMYPAREVEITVRDPYSWSTAISRDGTGFDTVLRAIVGLRQRDAPPRGVYYYGAFAAAANFMTWCQYGCVAGLSGLADPNRPTDTWSAGSVGVGWNGESSVGTAVHEVGHGHGRSHSPCAPGGVSIQGVDSRYPYSGAALGVWAYDVINKAMVAPTKNKDFMGYCDPTFVSDYTFGGLANFMGVINTFEFMIPHTVRLLAVHGDGTMEEGEEFETVAPSYGDARVVDLTLTDGRKGAVTAAYYPWDHLPGGLLVVPVGAPIRTMEVRNLVPNTISKLTLR